MLECLQKIVDKELRDYLEGRLNNFVVLFIMLIAFLVVSLVFSLKVLIDTLKKEVFRTRVLIKIIPVNELQKISRQIMMEKAKD